MLAFNEKICLNSSEFVDDLLLNWRSDIAETFNNELYGGGEVI